MPVCLRFGKLVSGLESRGKSKFRLGNLSAALGEVVSQKAISRTELSRQLGLGRTTTAELVGELSILGLVEESEPLSAPQGVGRPGLVVKPASTVGAVAVSPESDSLTLALVGLDGRIVDSERVVCSRPMDPQQCIDTAAVILDTLLQREAEPLALFGVGASIPGQVDRAAGSVLLAPRLGWKDVPFGRMLSERLGLPVAIENNARLATIAEHRGGLAQGVRNFVLVFAGAGGIGGGIVSDDRVLTGARGIAGEMGHLHAAESLDRDYGGLPGTLEALVRRDDLIRLLNVSFPTDEELDLLVQASESPAVQELARQQLAILGRALGSAANVLAPEVIVLSGFLGSIYNKYPDALISSINRHALPTITHSLSVRVSDDLLGSVLRGAGQLVFDALIADPVGSALGQDRLRHDAHRD